MVEADGTDDAVLVRRVLAGEPAAFAVLVDRHSGYCLRYAARMLGNREDAEDATQEALLRAYRSLDAYDGRRSFRTWLLSILVNRCRTALLHRARRERRVVADEDRVAQASVAPDGTDAMEFREALARSLGRLAPEQREAFLLKHVEQLEYTEMAAITGDGISALKMRVQRACDRLRRELGEFGDA